MIDLRGSVASRHRRSFIHRSTESPWAYRIGSDSVISRRDRPVIDVSVASFVSFPVERSTTEVEPLLPLPRDCSRSCCMSFKESERPVPSYPLMVEAIKTRYGPMSFRTSGRGIAAASSITKSSACPRTCESSGLMYWMTCRCWRCNSILTIALF